jgi:hypothetical protein
MKKAILEFDNIDELLTALNGVKYKQALWELDMWLRTQVKYSSEDVSTDTVAAYKTARETLHEHLGDLPLD